MAEIGSLEWIFEEMSKSEYKDYSEYFEVKDYKKHTEGNIYILDEDVNIDQFMHENNFTGGCYFNPSSRLVVAYVLEKDIEELHKKYSESNLRWQYKIYYPNTPEIVMTTRLNDGWKLEANFGLRTTELPLEFKMDSGATFSAINLTSLLTHINMTREQWHTYLSSNKYATVYVNTASEENVPYLSVSARLSIFDTVQPIVLYVDLKDRLHFPLLGFDVMSSFNMISHAGEDPLLLSFSAKHYKNYVYEHRNSDNASYDLSQLLTF